jgi:hypothetical protein
VGVGAAEGRGVCLEVGAVGAEDCAILEPEPVAERELLDLREIACAAAELGGDPADRAWATSWKRSRSESSSWSAAPSFINALWKALTKSLSLRVRNSPRYVLTSCACAASAISSASRFSSSWPATAAATMGGAGSVAALDAFRCAPDKMAVKVFGARPQLARGNLIES